MPPRRTTAGTRLSITALLDWFRPDTMIAKVLAQVDEFVPQFYDARPPADSVMTIAEPVDASRWAPDRPDVRLRFAEGDAA